MSEGGITAENPIGIQPAEDSLQPEIVPAQQIEPIQAQAPKPEEDEATHEAAERGKAFSEYADKRLADGVIKASDFGRELPPERSAEYALEIKKAALQIIDKLGIDESLFNDDRYNEAFLALADSWAANEASPAPSDAERTFLLQFGRLLAGNKSSFNQEAFARGEEDAGEYFIDASSSKYQRDKAYVDKAEAYMQVEKTADLEARIKDFGEGSLLEGVRLRLGITSADQEKPFKVIVVDSFVDNPKDGRIKWDALMGQEDVEGIDVGAFICNDPINNISTLVVPQNVYDAAIDNDVSISRTSNGTISHEYAHTQRSMDLGITDALGAYFNERIAEQASGGGAPHGDTAVIINTMNKLLPSGGLNVNDELRKCLTSESSRVDFLQLVSDNFGLPSTLLLLGVQPHLYRDEYGITAIPDVRLDPTVRSSDLLARVMEERVKIDPDAVSRYKAELSNLSPGNADIQLMLHTYGKITLPEELEALLIERSQVVPSDDE
jgi:hypothetical protein